MAQPADQVQAAEGAEETIFQLPTPVALAAGHTASVPIIDRSIPAERLDLATGNDAHPLSAIRITNDTGTSIPAGVLTLYDASGRGDLRRRRQAWRAAGRRAPTAVVRPGPAHDGRAQQHGRDDARLADRREGVLHITTRQREVLRVTITAPANEPRRVLVEIPKEGDRTLTLEGGPIAGHRGDRDRLARAGLAETRRGAQAHRLSSTGSSASRPRCWPTMRRWWCGC